MNETDNNISYTFEGVRGKIARAEGELALLSDQMDTFCRVLKESIVREVRQDTEQVWIFRGETPRVPLEWSVRIGEILYNLRSALDHLVWQLVLANEQTPGSRNAFPIIHQESGWHSRANRDLKGVSAETREVIRRLQPYTGGLNLPFDVSAYLYLHTLCNIDKHRHLILAAINQDLGGPIFDWDSPPVEGLRGRVNSGRIVEGKLLCIFNKAQTEIHPSLQFCIGLAVDRNEPMPIDSWLQEHVLRNLSVGPATYILGECLKAVRGATDLLSNRV